MLRIAAATEGFPRNMNDTHEAIAPILEFWFGPADADGNLPAREAWFKSDPDFDREVAAQLGPWQPRAARKPGLPAHERFPRQ